MCTIRNWSSHHVLDAKCPAGPDCDYLHQTELPMGGPAATQEWTLIRFPFSAPPQTPSLSSPPSFTHDALFRRQFRLQNVASGGFAAALGLTNSKEEANVFITADVSAATPWYFMHTTEDQEWTRYEDTFAIVTGQGGPSRPASLDHFFAEFIWATYGRFSPENTHHAWIVIPRDGAFVFRNFGSGKLLYGSDVGGPVVGTSATDIDSPACQWRLIDVTTEEVCPVLYDSTLSVVPPELGGAPPASASSMGLPSPQRLFARTEAAPLSLQRQFFDQLEYEHEAVREMLKGGYTSLLVAPQLIRGCKAGRVRDVILRDESAVLRSWTLKGKGNFNKC